jgi:hypothetical protein
VSSPPWSAAGEARTLTHPGHAGHAVHRLELLPEKRFLFFPNLAKVVGSTMLGERVAQLRPDVHIFGHTHFGWCVPLLASPRTFSHGCSEPYVWRQMQCSCIDAQTSAASCSYSSSALRLREPLGPTEPARGGAKVARSGK